MKEAVTKIAFSFYKEDQDNLKKLSDKTGMSKTEIMRQLLKKAVNDEKCIEIIAKNSFWEKVEKRKGLSSYNVQSVNEEKNSLDHTKESGVSSNTIGMINLFVGWYKKQRIQGHSQDEIETELIPQHWRSNYSFAMGLVDRAEEEYINDERAF